MVGSPQRVDFFCSCKHAEVHWAVFSTGESRRPRPGFRLYGVTARRLLAGGGLEDRLEALCALGLRGVQIREKDLAEKELTQLGKKCRAIFERHGATWLVNSSVRAANDAHADGVQLASAQDIADARAALGQRALLGKSVHSLAEARRAAAQQADFIVFGPIFFTRSKADYGPPQGLGNLREVCGQVQCPVFAIGGVTPQKARECRQAGAFGVAVMSALMDSPDPGRLLSDFRSSLGSL